MTPYVSDQDFTLYVGDAVDVLRGLPDGSVDCCVTSPPYLDARPEYPSPTPEQFGLIFGELRRVVTGPALFNVGRIWRGGVEQLWWTVLLETARQHGWELLDTLVWVKPNANPLKGNCFADSHEYVFALGNAGTILNTDAMRTPYAASSIARLDRGWTNHIAVKNEHSGRQRSAAELHEAGARPRSFVVVSIGKDKGNVHPAPMAEDLADYLVQLASWPAQTVLDPFMGSGTTALVARRHGRRSIGVELNSEYAKLAAARLQQLSLLAEPA